MFLRIGHPGREGAIARPRARVHLSRRHHGAGTYDTIPAIRDTGDRSISGHAETLEADIDAALQDRGISRD